MITTRIEHANATLYHADITEMFDVVGSESVDIILTDPPYPKEFLDCWKHLGAFAEHALKPGGHLLAMSGHVWLPEVFQHLTRPNLRYTWMLTMGPLTNGSHSNIGRRISRSYWKPILWFVKPPHDVHEQLKDWVRVDKKDKRFHEWGQGGGEWVHLLDQLKRPKPAVICDPFVGGGTTAVITAQYEGYEFIGSDIMWSCIATTRERLMTLQLQIPMD